VGELLKFKRGGWDWDLRSIKLNCTLKYSKRVGYVDDQP